MRTARQAEIIIIERMSGEERGSQSARLKRIEARRDGCPKREKTEKLRAQPIKIGPDPFVITHTRGRAGHANPLAMQRSLTPTSMSTPS